MHRNWTAYQMVVEQEVAFLACVDLLQGASAGKDLSPFAGARHGLKMPWGILSIVHIDTNHSLLGVRRETTHAKALAVAALYNLYSTARCQYFRGQRLFSKPAKAIGHTSPLC